MENLKDLNAFITIAETGSFTQASKRLGVSASAVSHLVRNLESRLNIQLFQRTTRSVSLTSAGEKLYRELQPLFAQIAERLDNASEQHQQLRGSIRINGADFVFMYVLSEKLHRFAEMYPDICLELQSDQQFVDIVKERFDAGIRLGGTIEKDMIAVKISPDLPMCLVASPDYLAQYGTPETPDELLNHRCIAFRQPTLGGVLPWKLQHPDTHEPLSVKVNANLLISSGNVARMYAKQGLGIAWVFESAVREELENGQLQKIMSNWTTTEPGAYLYYPNRQGLSPAFKALITFLKE